MNMRNMAVWGLIAALLIGMMMAMQGNNAAAGADEVNISEVRQMAEACLLYTSPSPRDA